MAEKRKEKIKYMPMPEDLMAGSGSMRPEQDVEAAQAEEKMSATKAAAVERAAQKVATSLDEAGFPKAGARAAAVIQAMGDVLPSTPHEALLGVVPVAKGVNAVKGARAAKVARAGEEAAEQASELRYLEEMKNPKSKVSEEFEEMRSTAMNKAEDARERAEAPTEVMRTKMSSREIKPGEFPDVNARREAVEVAERVGKVDMRKGGAEDGKLVRELESRLGRYAEPTALEDAVRFRADAVKQQEALVKLAEGGSIPIKSRKNTWKELKQLESDIKRYDDMIANMKKVGK